MNSIRPQPPKSQRPLLILDLDETLIYATENPLDRPAEYRVGQYFVYQRPGLVDFVESVAEQYELAVWSSATDGYVQQNVRQVFPPTLPLRFVWARSKCVHVMHPETGVRGHLKDLKKVKRLGFDLRQILIVDDTPYKVHRSYGNAIYVKAFEGDLSDAELPLLGRYLLHIATVPNYRALEKRGWRQQISQAE